MRLYQKAKISQAEMDKMVGHYLNGMSIRRAAMEVGHSSNALLFELGRRNITIRGPVEQRILFPRTAKHPKGQIAEWEVAFSKGFYSICDLPLPHWKEYKSSICNCSSKQEAFEFGIVMGRRVKK